MVKLSSIRNTAQAAALCQKARPYTGYVIQVKGYASAVGSVLSESELSQERAANCRGPLEQQGGIP